MGKLEDHTVASPVSGYTLPTAEPSSSTAASGTPNPVNYLPSSALTLNFPNTEGSSSVSAWVTVDKVGTNLADPNGKQWYRIRSTGKTTYPTNSGNPHRSTNNRLDSELPDTIAMNFSRKGGNYTGPTRTVEAIVSPQGGGTSIWGPGAVLKDALSMSGSGVRWSMSNSYSRPDGDLRRIAGHLSQHRLHGNGRCDAERQRVKSG